MRKLLRWTLAAMLLVGAVVPGIWVGQPVAGQTTPLAALAALVFPGTKSAPVHYGVYLGEGLILTNWHPWTLDGRYYADLEAPLSASRQVPEYDDDGVRDPGEHLLDMAECESEWLPVTPDVDANPACKPFARLEGAGFIFPGAGEVVGDEPLPVGRLLYASRTHDIALFAVDAAAAEARGAVSARLTLVRPQIDAPVLVAQPTGEQAPELSAAVLKTDLPLRLPRVEGRRLGSPWQVASLIVAALDALPDGVPVFDEVSGDLVGLIWRADDRDDGQYWLTPATAWLHALYAAQESIRHNGLEAVLAGVTPGVVDSQLTVDDPLTPELGNSGIDVQHVSLDLTFDLDTQTVAGTATLDIRATAHHLAVFALDAAGLTIEQVWVDGVKTAFVAKREKLQIQVSDTPRAYGDIFQVVIAYHASPESFRSAYMPGFDIGMFWGDDTVSTLNQPDGAHTWFPINDHPSDRATYAFRLRVPESLTAVANGQLVEMLRHDDGTRTFIWRMERPMASYLTVVAVASYVAVEDQAADGTPITHYVYEDQALSGRELFSYTDEALITLEQWFGQYPFASYGHVVAPVEGMALETQTMTTMPDTIMDWTELDVFELMVHELAHQWYGNTVTPAVWSDIWLNEGFARYAQWLARADRFGADAAFAGRMAAEQRLISDGRRSPLVDPLPEETFGIATYDKGGWVLHMLRVELGDEVFFKLLRTYAAQFADNPATTLDFWQLAEQLSGQDLGTFFTQWLLQADGIPNWRLYWTETDHGADVLLCPTEIEYYRLDVPVRLVGNSAVRDEVLVLDSVKGVSAQFVLDFVPHDLLADPDQVLLAQIEVQPIAVLPKACWGGL